MVVISAQNALATAAAKLEKHINLLKYTIFCLSVVILVSACRSGKIAFACDTRLGSGNVFPYRCGQGCIFWWEGGRGETVVPA
jgi:hypothetical protein